MEHMVYGPRFLDQVPDSGPYGVQAVINSRLKIEDCCSSSEVAPNLFLDRCDDRAFRDGVLHTLNHDTVWSSSENRSSQVRNPDSRVRSSPRGRQSLHTSADNPSACHRPTQ